MGDVLVLERGTYYAPAPGGGGNPGPAGEWDWLVEKLVGPVRERIWTAVIEFVSHELDILISPLREIRDRLAWLLAAAQAVPVAIRDELRGLRDRVVAALALELSRVVAAANALRDRITVELAALRDRVVGALALELSRVVAAANALRDRITAELAALRNLVVATIVTWLSRLVAGADALRDRIVTELANLRNLVVGAFTFWIARIEAVINSIPERIQRAGQQIQAVAWAAFQIWWSQQMRNFTAALVQSMHLGEAVLAGAMQTLAKGPPPELRAVTDRLTATLEGGMTVIQNAVLGSGQITPELAPTVAVRAFMTASALGFSAHLLSTAVELFHPLRYVGMHYLSGFLAEMGSFSSISTAVMGTMAREAIGYPMAYNIRARTRPTIPTAGDLQAMRRKHNLWASEFAQNMAYQGYSDFWIQRFEEYLPADPRLLELARIFESSAPTGAPSAEAQALLERLGIATRAIPDWWIEMKLALAGYNWIDIPQLKEALMHKVSSSARLRLDAAASTLFRNGYMDEAAFRATIDRSEKNPDRLELKVRAEKLAALGDDITDLVALYTDQFLKDVLTEADLLLALVNAGVTRHKAEILTARAAIRKLPKPAAPSKVAEEAELKKLQTQYSELYRRQYAGDLITADAYYDSLVAIGITTKLAAVSVQIEMTKRAVQERTVAVRDEAKAGAATRATYEKLYQAQFRAGALDADGYYQRLISIGLPDDGARGQVALELVRAYQLQQRADIRDEDKTALAEQRASAELYLRRYRDGTIDAAGLADRLLALGLSPVLAETTVALEEQKRQADALKVLAQVIVPALRVPFDLAVGRLKAQLVAGEITGEEFIQALVTSGLAEGTAALILDVLRPAPPVPPRR